MSENPPKGKKVTPEQQAEADARSKRNREAALEVQKKGMPLRAEQAQRERVREGMRNRTIREYRQEKEQEDREARTLQKDTKERHIDEFLDAKNKEAALRRDVKERLIRRNKAEEAIGPIIEAKKATAAALRKSAATTRSREARPKDLLAQAAVVEAEIAVLEQQLRDMVLRPNTLKQESAPKTVADDASIENGAETPVAAAEAPDRSAASPLEALDEQLRTLTEQYGASETTAAERDAIRENLKRLMAERDAMQAPRPDTIAYDEVGSFEGNQTAIDALEQMQDAVEEEPLELTEKVEPPKPPRDPMGPNPDGKPIAMLNSVLYRQARGIEKRTKANAQKMQSLTFPADPRYGGSVTTPAPEPVTPKVQARASRIAQKKKKRAWLVSGGAGAAVGIGASLLAFLNPWGKREETTAVKPPERPVAARSAEEAGVTVPKARTQETPPPIIIPLKEGEEVAKAPEAPSASAQEESPKPPEQTPSVPPSAEVTPAPAEAAPVPPAAEPEPPAPEAAEEQQSSVQIFRYGAKGKEVPNFLRTDRSAYDRAQTSAETQPEGAIVRFEYVSADPLTNAPITIYGAFQSLGSGNVMPLTQDPETNRPFTPPDPTKMSRALRADEVAAVR